MVLSFIQSTSKNFHLPRLGTSATTPVPCNFKSSSWSHLKSLSYRTLISNLSVLFRFSDSLPSRLFTVPSVVQVASLFLSSQDVLRKRRKKWYWKKTSFVAYLWKVPCTSVSLCVSFMCVRRTSNVSNGFLLSAFSRRIACRWKRDWDTRPGSRLLHKFMHSDGQTFIFYDFVCFFVYDFSSTGAAGRKKKSQLWDVTRDKTCMWHWRRSRKWQISKKSFLA